jgi:hypothetical protein
MENNNNQHIKDAEIINTEDKKGDKIVTIGVIVAVVIIILSLLYWFFGIDKSQNRTTTDGRVAEELTEEEIAELKAEFDALVATDEAKQRLIDAGYSGDIFDEMSEDGSLSADTTTSATEVVENQKPFMASEVNIALLASPDLFDYSNNNREACDVVVMVPQTIAPTSQVLNAAIAILFTDTFDYGFPPANFIATQKNLAFQGATIENSVARVFLTGTVGPIVGVCDVPRIETQIEETALQFATVNRVEIYLNGEILEVE